MAPTEGERMLRTFKSAELVALLALGTLLFLASGASAQESYPPPEGPSQVLPTTIERAPSDEDVDDEPAPEVAPDDDARPAADEDADAAAGELSRSGAQVTTLVVLGAVALVGGAVLLLTQRRIRQTTNS